MHPVTLDSTYSQLDPAIHGDVIDVHASLGEQLLDVTVGQAVPQVRTATEITSRGNRNPANADGALEKVTRTVSSQGRPSTQQTSQDFRCQAAALLRCAQAVVSS
jgi:hypothetical protein